MTRRSPDRILLPLVILAALLGTPARSQEADAAPTPPKAEACTITCDAGPSVTGGVPPVAITLLSHTEVSGCAGPVTYEWRANGQVISNEPICPINLTGAGDAEWSFTATAGGQSCTKSGWLWARYDLTFAGNATPFMGPPPLDVDFRASGGTACADGDGEYPAYKWKFDGGTSTTDQNTSRTYTTPGLKGWSVETWSPSFGMCWGPTTIAGKILVEDCFKVGELSICSDEHTKAADSETHTFSGNVVINGVLKFSGDVVIVLPSAGATAGTLTTTGSVQVQLKSVTETLLQGPGLGFDVDGTAKTLTPKFTDTEWAATLAGLKLWNSGKPISLTDDGVVIEPTAYAGYGSLILFSFKMNVLYEPGGEKKLNGAEMISGQLTPGLTFMNIALNYDYQQNQLEGTIAIGFPFMGTWSMSATVRIKFNCDGNYAGINGIDMSVGFPEAVPLGTTGWEWAGFTTKLDNFCDFAKFKIFIGADLTLVGIPGEVFTLSQLGLGYYRPYLVVIEGGTATFLGFPVGSLSGRISFKPGHAGVTMKGWVNLASVYQANVSGFLSASKGTIAGSSSGSIQIPDFSCSWYNVPCRTVKAAITSAVSLPVVLNAQEMDMWIGPGGGGYAGMFRGMQKIGPLSVAVVLQYSGGEFDLLVGPNYADVIGIGVIESDPRAAERTVTLTVPQPQALFAVAANSESSPLPAITLRNPQGATITPGNVGSYPGVHYVGNESLKTALFRLDEAAAGTWTLAVTNLSTSDVTFQCLVPTPAPVTTFTSVSPGSGSVGVQASVSPTSPDTKVSLFFSEESAGGMGQPVVENLSAASGSVSTTWNTSGLTAGTYYLFARTDDGKNPPLVTYHANPVAVGGSPLQPPTNLSGSFSGTACDLQWTASPSAGVAGYRVLYTDSPSSPGYPSGVTAPAGTSSRVESLTAGGSYRFAVVAWDAGGSESAPSVPWYTGAPPAQDVRELQSAIPVSDSLTPNAWKYYKIAVPAEPLSLEVFTGAASGDVDLYLKKGAKPGSSDYDYRSNGTSGVEKITVTPTSSPRPLSEGEWYLGVFGKTSASYSVGATLFGGSHCAVTCSATVPPSAAPSTPVSFQGQASTQDCSEPVTYTWTFGDKSPPATGQNATHTYASEGTYTWTLTAVSGEAGCVTSGTVVITSGPTCTLTCTATVPASGSAGSAVPFRAQATTANCSGQPAYAWTFGDGGTSTQQNPDHTYAAAGSYPWTLTVTVPGASPCTRGGTLSVGGACTQPSISGHPQSQTIPSGYTATLRVTAGGTAPLTYQWYQGASGNTSTPVGSDSDSFTTPALSATSSYWVRVSNTCGSANSSTATVTVETGCVLLCEANANPNSGNAPLAVAFTASATPVNCRGGEGGAEAVTVLTSGVPVSGTVAPSGWALYKIAVPPDATQLEVKTTGTTTDLDLYVRFGAEPTGDLWDYRPYTTGGNETVTVTPASSPRPLQGGDWYIGVYGFIDGGSFTLTATASSGGGGTTALTSGVPVSGSVAPYGWAFYSIAVPSGATQLEVKTTGSSADVDLYVRYGSLPDADNWDYRPYTLSGNETVTVTPSSSPRPLQAGTWYAGVYGFIDGGNFTITATATGGSTCTLACTATAPATGTAGTPVAFASTATPSNCTGSPTFAWTFGDGGTSFQQNPTHAYASAGTYNWNLVVAVQGVTCTRTGSLAISSGGGTTYAWTFGDGGTASQQNPNHTYASAGTYTWTMIASWDGKTCSKSGAVSATGSGGTPGDCDGSGTVSIGEVQKAINMFLGTLAPACGVDCNGDGSISIGEVQKVINAFLGLTASC
jgi:PKD repeat protein